MTFFGFTSGDFKITYNLFKLTLRDRYLGSKMGMLWSIINPLLMMGIYTFVFGFVFKTKLPGNDSSFSYLIWLISGYSAWMAISDGLVNSTNSVVSGASLIKNVVFKTEILPIAYTLLGLFPMIVGLSILFVLLIVSGIGFSVNIFWLILLVPLQMFFLSGIGYFLSALAVFLRDITQIITSILMILIFFTPIFYSLDSMPGPIKKVNFLNPFYHIVQQYRAIIVDQHNPDFYALLYIFVLSLCLWIVGLKFFRKLKGHFQSCL